MMMIYFHLRLVLVFLLLLVMMAEHTPYGFRNPVFVKTNPKHRIRSFRINVRDLPKDIPRPHSPQWKHRRTDYLSISVTARRSLGILLQAAPGKGIPNVDWEQQKQQQSITEQRFDVTLPRLSELLTVQRGDFLASDPFQVLSKSDDHSSSKTVTHEFRVLVYPRGGGQYAAASTKNNNGNQMRQEEGGFGMGYKMVPLFQKGDPKNDKVGIYLQYLPKEENKTDALDVTFSLRLKGKQKSRAKFDVEWSTGIRFVAPEFGNLRDGTGGDFGAHLMQSALLPTFLGGEESDHCLEAEVRMKMHAVHTLQQENQSPQTTNTKLGGFFSFDDIRTTDGPNTHDGENVRVGKIIVPVLRKLSERPRLFEIGAYPGVEYRIMRIFHPETGEELFASIPGADYELRPIYSLVPALERKWPVRVNETELPKLFTVAMYNTVSAIGSFLTAFTGLATAFVVSQLVSFFFIPSKSMEPTLRVGDVLLVDKTTPRLLKNPSVGDVVLFNPNNKLQDIVRSNGGKISDRDLFVKRVAAGSGDIVSVDKSGSVSINGHPAVGRRDLCEEEPLRLIQKFVTPVSEEPIGRDQVFVMGDCSSVSVDSRVWGPLNKADIVGRPILRIWPLGRWGTIRSLPDASMSAMDDNTLELDWSN